MESFLAKLAADRMPETARSGARYVTRIGDFHDDFRKLGGARVGRAYPLWLRVCGSFASPVFVVLSGMMVAYGTRRNGQTVRHYVIRGAVLLAIASLRDMLVWDNLPLLSMDVLYRPLQLLGKSALTIYLLHLVLIDYLIARHVPNLGLCRFAAVYAGLIAAMLAVASAEQAWKTRSRNPAFQMRFVLSKSPSVTQDE